MNPRFRVRYKTRHNNEPYSFSNEKYLQISPIVIGSSLGSDESSVQYWLSPQVSRAPGQGWAVLWTEESGELNSSKFPTEIEIGVNQVLIGTL